MKIVTKHKTVELAQKKRRQLVGKIIDRLLITFGGATDISIEQGGLMNTALTIKHQEDKIAYMEINSLKDNNIKLEVSYCEDIEEILECKISEL